MNTFVTLFSQFTFFAYRSKLQAFLIFQLLDDSALIPNCPYYDLPAGLMLPLIEMDDILVCESLTCCP